MNSGVIPTPETIQSILTKLLGLDISVAYATDTSIDNGHVAVYVSQEAEPLALCIADTGMVVLAGCAFLGTPSSDAHTILVRGDLPADVIQSYEEIANILSRVISNDGYRHLKLEKVHPPGYLTHSNIAIDYFNTTVSFHVDIPGYGTGLVTFLVQ